MRSCSAIVSCVGISTVSLTTKRCCCGTWLSIIDKLDYIQGMGFDAIWISPVSREFYVVSSDMFFIRHVFHQTCSLHCPENVDVYTPYNYAYHGYWVHDPLTLNPRFGSSDDLKALSNALHQRGMSVHSLCY